MKNTLERTCRAGVFLFIVGCAPPAKPASTEVVPTWLVGTWRKGDDFILIEDNGAALVRQRLGSDPKNLIQTTSSGVASIDGTTLFISLRLQLEEDPSLKAKWRKEGRILFDSLSISTASLKSEWKRIGEPSIAYLKP
jgi:hypothetical protein